MRTLYYITYIIMFIGALNLGLIAFFNIDLVGSLSDPVSIGTKIVFVIIGLSALINLILRLTTFSCVPYRDRLDNPL